MAKRVLHKRDFDIRKMRDLGYDINQPFEVRCGRWAHLGHTRWQWTSVTCKACLRCKPR